MRTTVVLLHGLGPGLGAWTMAPLAWRFRAEGCAVVVPSYGRRRLADAAAAVLDALPPPERGVTLHLVGHSFGGLVAREVAARGGRPDVGRVVAVGSPMRGAEAARRPSAATRLLLGPAVADLDPGARDAYDRRTPWAEVGCVAGALPLTRLGGRAGTDSVVPVRDTRFGGMSGHVVVTASHLTLLASGEAFRQGLEFLLHGEFRKAPERRRPVADGARRGPS